MPGVVKPPWVSKKDFYRTSFNYCDRWCEKCQLTEICRVFQSEQKSREKFIRQGKNPDSLGCGLEIIKENFKKIRKLLEKDALRLGIDLSKIKNSNCQSLPEPQRLPLYKLVNRFSGKLKGLLQKLEVVPIEANEKLILENIEIISYYRLLIPAKIYRAFASKLEEEKDEDNQVFDSKTSAFISLNGLVSISSSLLALASHQPLDLFRGNLAHLGKVSLDLAKTIDLEFDLNQVESFSL